MNKTEGRKKIDQYLLSFKDPDNIPPTNTIAKYLYSQYPELWTNKEQCRGTIRYALGQQGGESKKYSTVKTEKAQQANRLGIPNPYSIPKSDYIEWEPYLMPKSFKALVLSDVHIPYHSVDAIEISLEKGYKEGIKTVILNGDILDFHKLSRFVKDPLKRNVSEELEMAREFLRFLKSNFDIIYYKLGNHEERYENYMKLKAPELYGIPDFKLDNLLRFGEIGIELIEDQRIIKAGRLNILHGHEFGRSVFSPVNPARGYYMRGKVNSLCGHNHQTSEHTEPNLNGDIVTTWSSGCLCGLHPEYARVNKWNHGFTVVSVDSNGFEVDNYRIINGKIR